jgi:pimeloyl-ACP methyl ester carboxylesterase
MLEETPTDERLDAVLGETLPVTSGATPARGRFPVVLVSAGLGSPAGKLSTICERIAAAGYLVAAVPTPPLAGWQIGFDQTALETIMRDLEVTLGTISGLDSADHSRVALVGWSIGGVAQTLLQMRNPLVDALVSLDGGTGYEYGSALAKGSPWFRERDLQAPLLDVRALATERVPRAWDVLDLPRGGQSWRLDCDRLIHADMTTDFGELAPRATGSENENLDAIDFMKETVVAFLDATLKGMGSAIRGLQDNVPAGVALRRAH